MSGPAENLATAKRYIHAIESGTLGGQIILAMPFQSKPAGAEIHATSPPSSFILLSS